MYTSIPIQIGYKSNKEYKHNFHSHSEFEIYLFHEGKGNYLIADKIYALQPGDLIIMHGMTLHRANVQTDLPYIRSIVHFDPSYAENLFCYPNHLDVLKPFHQLKNHRISLSNDQLEEISNLLNRVQSLSQSNNVFDYHELHTRFMDLLVLVYRYFESSLDVHQVHLPGSKEKHAQNIITYIEQNFREDLHLEDLESDLHVNRHYLSKLFKEVTGITIFHYLLQRRINEAKMLLLLDNSLSLTYVSYQVGFKHPAHFSRVFKERVGCAPDIYRKQLQRQDANES
ncbi:helix-turn-helix transcriptional regulator [Chengkuizengella axinellae]|uniref:AraC family transcriptional regulator n=1 Tax=Chengkuizengella axinellae TaxID=3064388 RepID=A0ABT9J671_9BACL|nr:AraC family transcriptional regulator [Chengkuizengella sp. 2205SS18-9]MDP5276449.1 AraC family transcriptional regulator [Chengkuizengella sp. 2205SS18-9]